MNVEHRTSNIEEMFSICYKNLSASETNPEPLNLEL